MKKRQTETPPFFNRNLMRLKDGVYTCALCGNELFVSEGKVDKLSGWPISIKPIEKGIATRLDMDMGRIRTEIVCSKCNCHLGHVVREETKPAAVRYCIDSMALCFEKNR